MISSDNFIISTNNAFDVSQVHFEPENIIENVASLTLCTIFWAKYFKAKGHSKPFGMSYNQSIRTCSIGKAQNIQGNGVESSQLPLKVYVHLGKIKRILV